jgi:LmbE family N-acetylglucosaminyl deacetylase
VKDVTLLISHPDDEALFCWPVLDRAKRIICASNDSENPERAWCRERGKCLEEVAELLGADVIQLPYNSEFYRLPTRDWQLKRLAETLLRHMADAEIVFTHNAWGEYGNLDHLIVHHIARVWQAETRRELLVSDIVTEINWLPVRAWKQGDPWEIDSYGGNPNAPDVASRRQKASPHTFELDRPLYDRIKAIYDARGCWTWSFEPVERCRVYSL